MTKTTQRPVTVISVPTTHAAAALDNLRQWTAHFEVSSQPETTTIKLLDRLMLERVEHALHEAGLLCTAKGTPDGVHVTGTVAP